MFLTRFLARRIVTRPTFATVAGHGEFYCLYCRADRDYEQRRWQRTTYLFRFWAVRGTFGEFVICLVCGSTYDLECLDETSTAELDELLVEPPWEVTDVTDSGSGRAFGGRTGLAAPERQLSGYSPARRH
jgi:hypothetical protein